MEVPT
jgi:hypothetical protein